ncbi:MAG: HigA family addiction module antidote protein [Bdellovibrio sp.]|nr:HigA family addiction module antidote protein [Bdellovibrio sp.]
MLPKNRPPAHPGEILQDEFLTPLGVTQTSLAKHFDWTHAKINELVMGKRGVTPEVALSLAEALGTSAELWLNLPRNYDLWFAQKTHKKKAKLLKAA